MNFSSSSIVGHSFMVMLCAAAMAEAGQTQCFPAGPESIPGAARATDVALADVDGDTFDDYLIVDADSYSSIVQILRSDGHTYVPYLSLEFPGLARHIATGTIDANASADLVIATFNKLYIYLNKGAGYDPTPTAIHELATNPYDLVVHDMDGDGVDDICLAERALSQVSVRYLTAAGQIDSIRLLPLPAMPDQIVSGDFNDDGLDDLAVRMSGKSEVAVYWNRFPDEFEILEIPFDHSIRSIEAADWNGDGRSDLAAGLSDATLKLLFSEGHSFAPAQNVNLPADAGNIVPIDIDLDGDLDMLCLLDSYAPYEVINEGDEVFVGGRAVGTASGTKVFVVDADRDSFNDLLIQRGPGVSLVRDDGNGGFDVPYGIFAAGLGRIIDRADLNNDGIDDIVATVSGDVVVRWGGSRDNNTFDLLYDGTDLLVALSADLTGDGRPDIYAASEVAPVVLIQRKDGTFQAVKQNSPLPTSTDAAFGDFNHDGIIDVVSMLAPYLAPYRLNVLTNDGTGRLTETYFFNGVRIEDIAAGDFNFDGYDDIAIGGETSIMDPNDPWGWPYRVFGYLLNDGAGGFLDDVWVPGGESGHSIAVADIDQDGDLDASVSFEGFQCHCAYVQLNTNDGTGTFSHEYPPGTNCCIFGEGSAFANINGDGWLDMLSCSDYGIWLYPGTGPGEFDVAPDVMYGAYEGVDSPLAGDFDGDGLVDLAFTVGGHSGPHFLYILYGSCTTFCRSDLNVDRIVNVVDLFELLASWGPCPNCDADIDHDSVVGQEDLTNLLRSWGGCEN